MKKVGLLLFTCLVLLLSFTAAASAETYTFTARISLPASDSVTVADTLTYHRIPEVAVVTYYEAFSLSPTYENHVTTCYWYKQVSSGSVEAGDVPYNGNWYQYRDYYLEDLEGGSTYAYVLQLDCTRAIYDDLVMIVNGVTVKDATVNNTVYDPVARSATIVLGTYTVNAYTFDAKVATPKFIDIGAVARPGYFEDFSWEGWEWNFGENKYAGCSWYEETDSAPSDEDSWNFKFGDQWYVPMQLEGRYEAGKTYAYILWFRSSPEGTLTQKVYDATTVFVNGGAVKTVNDKSADNVCYNSSAFVVGVLLGTYQPVLRDPYVIASFEETAVTAAGRQIPWLELKRTQFVSDGTVSDGWYYSNFLDDYRANVTWLKVITAEEAVDNPYALSADGTYYELQLPYASPTFEDGRTYAQTLVFYMSHSTVTDADALKDVDVTVNRKPYSQGLGKVDIPGMGTYAYVILREVIIGDAGHYITANFTDTTVPEAGKKAGIFPMEYTTGTPAAGQFSSNFYPITPRTRAVAVWLKNVTESEAKQSAHPITVDGKVYDYGPARLIDGKYYEYCGMDYDDDGEIENEFFEEGRTYMQIFMIYADAKYSLVTDKTGLSKVAVTVNSKPFNGLKLVDLGPEDKTLSVPVGYVVLRTVTIGETPEIPETGDNTPVAFTAGLMLLAGAALVVLRKRAR